MSLMIFPLFKLLPCVYVIFFLLYFCSHLRNNPQLNVTNMLLDNLLKIECDGSALTLLFGKYWIRGKLLFKAQFISLLTADWTDS